MVEREAARVPEHHAGALFLLMEQVHAVADGAVVVVVHFVLLENPGTDEAAKKAKAPSVAGGALGFRFFA